MGNWFAKPAVPGANVPRANAPRANAPMANAPLPPVVNISRRNSVVVPDEMPPSQSQSPAYTVGKRRKSKNKRRKYKRSRKN